MQLVVKIVGFVLEIFNTNLRQWFMFVNRMTSGRSSVEMNGFLVLYTHTLLPLVYPSSYPTYIRSFWSTTTYHFSMPAR